jgi:hypothetical protein
MMFFKFENSSVYMNSIYCRLPVGAGQIVYRTFMFNLFTITVQVSKMI